MSEEKLKEILRKLEGYYNSSIPKTMIAVHDEGRRVNISSQPNMVFKLERDAEKGHLQLGIFKMIHFDGDRVEWTSTGKDKIVWSRVTPEEAMQKMFEYMTIDSAIPQGDSRDRQDTTTGEQVHEKEGERKQRMSLLKVVNDLKLPQLKEIDFIKHHLESVERLGQAVDLFNKKGSIDPIAEIPFVIKFVGTLSHTTAHGTAEEIIRRFGERWSTLKEVLLRRYCRRDTMKVSIQRRLTGLKFQDIRDFEEFIDQGVTIVNIVEDVYGKDKSEIRPVIREILSRLPFYIRTDVIKGIYQIASDDEDWETTIPFTDRDEECTTSISSIIRECCITQLTLEQIKGDRPNGRRDETSNKEEKAKGKRVDWTSKEQPTQNEVFTHILRGETCKDEQRMETSLKRLAITNYKKVIGRNGRPYYLFTSKQNEAELKGRVEKELPLILMEQLKQKNFNRDSQRSPDEQV